MTYHIVIKEERRAAPRDLAEAITSSQSDADGKLIASSVKTQLRTHSERVVSFSNIAYCAEWDGKTPYIRVFEGAIADLNHAYMGWPMVTEEEYRAANPVVPQ